MSTSAHLTTPTAIWTIGHSTRSIEEFLSLLAGSRIEVITDVRSFPGSRKYPQYGREALAATLVAHAIGYHWLPALGGRRRVSPDSPNIAWRNDLVSRNTPRSPARIGRSVARRPQLHSAKQLRVRSHDDGRRAHRDCADTHGEIKPPANQQTPRDRDGDEVISARPNEILHHLSVGCA